MHYIISTTPFDLKNMCTKREDTCFFVCYKGFNCKDTHHVILFWTFRYKYHLHLITAYLRLDISYWDYNIAIASNIVVLFIVNQGHMLVCE